MVVVRLWLKIHQAQTTPFPLTLNNKIIRVEVDYISEDSPLFKRQKITTRITMWNFILFTIYPYTHKLPGKVSTLRVISAVIFQNFKSLDIWKNKDIFSHHAMRLNHPFRIKRSPDSILLPQRQQPMACFFNEKTIITPGYIVEPHWRIMTAFTVIQQPLILAAKISTVGTTAGQIEISKPAFGARSR
ncbi:MAG: hypothetical protein B0D94_01790 [Candidatus Sedimenticola endophacoides]|nr:MAG: hypothetical protein B0D94_01790 [Candidatus Sedimenticola endophacoides]